MSTQLELEFHLDAGGAPLLIDNLKKKFFDFFAGVKAWATGSKSAIDETSNALKGTQTEAEKMEEIFRRTFGLAAADNKAESAFKGIESEERRAHIAGQLITRTLGVEMPRALENVIAHSSLLGPVFKAAFGASIFAAVIPVIGEIGKKIIEITDDMGGYTEEIKRMEQETIQASRKNFIEPGTLGASLEHLNEINTRLADIEEKKKQLSDQSGQRNADAAELDAFTEGNASQGAELESQTQLNRLNAEAKGLEEQKEKLLEHERQQLEEIVISTEKQAALAGKTGFAKIAVEQQQALKALNDQFGVLSRNSQEYQRAVAAAHKISTAQIVDLERQATEQTLALRHQVADESLHDEDKIRADEEFSIREVEQLRQRSLITLKDIKEREVAIHQQAAIKIRALNLEISKVEQSTQDFILEQQLSTLQGEDRLNAERNLKIKQFEDERKNILSQAGEHLTSLELERLVSLTQKEQALWTATDAEITAGRNQAAEERAQVLEQAAERQRDAEAAAALATVPPWLKAYAQIQVESNKRLLTIDKQEQSQLSKYKAGSQEYVAIESAAEAERAAVHAEINEKIIAENEKLTQQLGSELESVFNDIGSGKIGQTILKNMEHLFFQILAQWLLTMGSMKSGAGNILGSIVFGQGSVGAGVFGGGGGGAGNPLGGLLGPLFGGGGTASGTPPFISSGANATAPGVFGLGGLPLGGGSTASVPAASSGPDLSSLFGLSGAPFGGGTTGVTPPFAPSGSTSSFGSSLLTPSGALSTASFADTITQPLRAPQVQGGLLGGLKNLFSAGGAGIGLTAGLLPLLGNAVGGKLGLLGASLPLFAALNPFGLASGLISGALGLGLASAAGGGLLGFGVGLQHGPLAGALAGAGGGIGIGALLGLISGIGGPIGLVVGGIVGLLGGIFGGLFGGSKRKREANDYFTKQIQPAIQKIEDEYKSFQLDSLSAHQQLDQLDQQAEDELKKLKDEGKSVWKNKVHPAILAADKDIDSFEVERQRRSGLLFGPPQFHDGGYVSSSYSSFATVPGELHAVLRKGEFVVNASSTADNLQTLQRINGGSSVGGDIHIHGSLIQAQSVDERWLRNGGIDQILAALNRAKQEGKV
ncbi:MAG TPA: hypothetical protein VKZ53_22400 [Candidatus Angelobacter sp.]|nr:hypothetical protein [Candidatus Angelobacter sp.]